MVQNVLQNGKRIYRLWLETRLRNLDYFPTLPIYLLILLISSSWFICLFASSPHNFSVVIKCKCVCTHQITYKEAKTVIKKINTDSSGAQKKRLNIDNAPEPNPIHQLPRHQDHPVLFENRTLQMLSHLHQLKIFHKDACPCGDGALIPEHVFQECPTFTNEDRLCHGGRVWDRSCGAAARTWIELWTSTWPGFQFSMTLLPI